jgi:hypothetical protein
MPGLQLVLGNASSFPRQSRLDHVQPVRRAESYLDRAFETTMRIYATPPKLVTSISVHLN